MKILFVSSLSSNYSDQNSSYMHRLVNLQNSLESHGVTTDMLYLGDLFFNKPAIIQPLNLIKILKKTQGYDFIHAGGLGSAYVIGLVKPFLDKNIQIIYDVHGDVMQENILMSLKSSFIIKKLLLFQISIMEFFAEKKSDYFIVVSNTLKKRLVEKSVSPEKIEIIYNGVDTNFFKQRISSQYEKHEKFVVGYAGRFQKWQGIDLFLESIELLKNEKIYFKIIGFQRQDSDLKKKISQNFNSNIDLIDNLSREELLKKLFECDILVIPRISHPALDVAFPTKFAEYISCGIPVIVTNVGDIAELTIKSDCGILCDPDPLSFSNAILISKSMDSDRLRKMGMNGRHLAEQILDLKSIGGKYFILLQMLQKAGNND